MQLFLPFMNQTLELQVQQQPMTCNVIKNRVQHKCFPVKFAIFLRIPFFREHLQQLLLKNVSSYFFLFSNYQILIFLIAFLYILNEDISCSKTLSKFFNVSLCNPVSGGKYQFLGKIPPFSFINIPLSNEDFYIFYLFLFITTSLPVRPTPF